ncbi:unnamed protein product [Phaeothamnion confervicola]
MADDNGIDRLKGRDADEIATLKKLILDEKSRKKSQQTPAPRRRGVGGGDSDEEEEKERKLGKKEPAAPAVKKIWRRGKLVELEAKDGAAFRDRAEERRKGVNPDYDDEVARIVEVDAEKSKYLGGDMKHTHLVRGLDYALLVKMREENRQQRAEQQRDAATAFAAASTAVAASEKGAGAGGVTGTAAGAGAGAAAGADGSRRQQQLQQQQQLPVRTLAAKALYGVWQQLQSARESKVHGRVQDFSRVAYEFDMDPDSSVDIPVQIRRGRGDADDGEEKRHNYMMDDQLLQRLGRGLESFRQHGKARRHRKRKAVSAPSASSAPSVASTMATPVHSAMDDDDNLAVAVGMAPQRRKLADDVDIFAGIGGTSSAAPSLQPAPLPLPTAPAAIPDYFINLRAAAGKRTAEKEAAATAAAVPSKEDIARSIRAAAAAATARITGSDPAAAAAAVANADAMRSGVVERDIFARAPVRGDAVAGHGGGGYDFYPENADYETYDSDEDAEAASAARRDGMGGGSGGGGKREGKGGGKSGGKRKEPKQ